MSVNQKIVAAAIKYNLGLIIYAQYLKEINTCNN